jgi:hypothetical protein
VYDPFTGSGVSRCRVVGSRAERALHNPTAVVPIILLVCVLVVGVLGLAAIVKVIREELHERRQLRQRFAAREAHVAKTRRLQAEHAAQLVKHAEAAPAPTSLTQVFATLEQSQPLPRFAPSPAPLPPPQRTAHGTSAPPLSGPRVMPRGTPPPLSPEARKSLPRVSVMPPPAPRPIAARPPVPPPPRTRR